MAGRVPSRAASAAGGLLFYEGHYTALSFCCHTLRRTMKGQIEEIQVRCQAP